jgi:hypothetical protein
VHFASAEPIEVTLSWSCGTGRGKTVLSVSPQGSDWTVPLGPADRAVPPGKNITLVFDLAAGAARSLYLLDLTGTRVWHPDEKGDVTGAIPVEGAPAQGTWRISKHERGLFLSGTVADDDIQDAARTPGGRDGVQVTLDLRQDARFGDLSFDEDVHLFCLNVQEKPRFGLGIVPLWGRGMSCAGNGGAERTDDGYAWHFFIHQGFKDRDEPFDVERSDFVGFNIDIVDRDRGQNGKLTANWIHFAETESLVQTFPAFLQILDMKKKLRAGRAVVLNLWGG